MYAYNVLVLIHIDGGETISDMRVIDAYAVTRTSESAQDLERRLTEEAYDRYKLVTSEDVVIYIKPYEPR